MQGSSIVSIGPLTIPAWPLIGLIAAAVTYLVVRILISAGSKNALAAAVDRSTTMLLLFLLGWKLGPVVPYWREVLNDPIVLLRLPGGRPGIVAGCILVGAYLAVTATAGRFKPKEGRFLAIMVGGTVLSYLALGAGFDYVRGNPLRASSDDAQAPAIRTTQTIPQDLLLPMLNRPTVSSGDLLGQPALLTFWATWCGPCRAELPVKKRLHDDFSSEVSFIAINLIRSDSREAVQRYAIDHDLPYPVGLDQRNQWANAFLVRGTPTTVLLDQDGTVMGRWFGPVAYDTVARQIRLVTE